MRVLLVGTVPPPGGPAAHAFAREAARRSALGDAVEVLSPHSLSSAHATANLGGRRLARELRARARDFDGLELRVEASLGLDVRPAGALLGALASFANVTLFVDSPIPFPTRASTARAAGFWASASSIIVANEVDRATIVATGVSASIIEVVPRALGAMAMSPNWPSATDDSLQPAVLDTVRRRARADGWGPGVEAPMSMLVGSTKRVRPSFKGSIIWLIRRVVGKSRGAVTKVLRPTPKKES